MFRLCLIVIASLLFISLNVNAESFFSHESQLSILNTGGNTEIQTYNLEVKNTYEKDKNKYHASGHYTYGKSQDIESARNWSALVRYDRMTSRKLSVFLSEEIEADKFQGLDRRSNTDLGLSYKLYQTEQSSLVVEAGYRYTYERSTDITVGSENFQKGRLFAEYAKSFREGLSARIWTELIPNFTDSEDYILRFQPSLRVSLTNVFSLSLSYRGVYDNQPSAPGRKKYDYTYTTSIIAKF